MSALLGWAHHDCTSDSTAPTQDTILNDMIARQHKVGIYTDEEQESEEFDMSKVKPGQVVFVYSESSRRKMEASPEMSEISEEDEEDGDENQDEDGDEEDEDSE